MGCTVTRQKPVGNSDNLMREQKNTVAAEEINSDSSETERMVQAEIQVITEHEHKPTPRTVACENREIGDVHTQATRTDPDYSWLIK